MFQMPLVFVSRGGIEYIFCLLSCLLPRCVGVIQELLKEKSADLRTRAAEYLLLVVQTWDANTLDKCGQLEDMIRVCLEFFIYSRWSEQIPLHFYINRLTFVCIFTH